MTFPATKTKLNFFAGANQAAMPIWPVTWGAGVEEIDDEQKSEHCMERLRVDRDLLRHGKPAERNYNKKDRGIVQEDKRSICGSFKT